jgi:hypothetical protein
MEKLLDALASMRKEYIEEFEEDSGVDFEQTVDWDDDLSFYAGLDRGIELAMQAVNDTDNYFGKEE